MGVFWFMEKVDVKIPKELIDKIEGDKEKFIEEAIKEKIDKLKK